MKQHGVQEFEYFLLIMYTFLTIIWLHMSINVNMYVCYLDYRCLLFGLQMFVFIIL